MFDILIKKACIIDGAETKSHRADVAVKDGLIAAVDPEIDAPARTIIEAESLTLAPGFIDLHAHTDTYHLTDPSSEIKIRQGVCLDVAGNCGISAAPTNDVLARELGDQRAFVQNFPEARTMADYAAALDAVRPAARVMTHVGHSVLRIKAMGQASGPPDTQQLETMKRDLEEALEQGAAGLSTGLYYPPSGFAATGEVIELAGIVARRGGFHASHVRNEAEQLLESIDEIIAISRASGAAGHISHLKAAGRNNWSKAEEAAARIESARSRGLDITCDVYPYSRSSTGILALIPPWAQDGGVPSLIERIDHAAHRDRLIKNIRDGLPDWENIYHNAGFDGITIVGVKTPANKKLVGVTIEQAAAGAGADPFEFLLDLIKAEAGAVNIIASSMNEEVVARFIALPFAMIGSDGNPNSDMPHPRLYGAFPRVIRRFVRELKVLTLEEAVAKMTGLTARRLGLKNYGLIQKGCRADLVLFDPDHLTDTAEFERPRSFPEGMDTVMVGGEIVFTNGAMTSARPGGFVPGRGKA